MRWTTVLENGYIKDFRSLLTWEWFKDPATAHLWEYLRLACNWEERSFRGRIIKRGQLVTSYPSMAAATGLSVQNVRTAIKHLKSTGEITVEPTDKYSVITIVKYSEYQSDRQDANTVSNTPHNSQLAGIQQASNSQLTTIKESKKARKQECKKESGASSAAPRFEKPTAEAVKNYCEERNNRVDAQRFFDFYEAKGWKVGREPMKDWKACVRTWEKRDGTERPAKPQANAAQLTDWEREQLERVKAHRRTGDG